MEEQEYEQEQEQGMFPTMEAKAVSKPFWFVVRLKSNIENIEESGLVFKRFTESILIIEFDYLEEAQLYFSKIEEEDDMKFTILYDYSKN